jgi:tetratricopeptide (TPR) repeat protein
MPDDKRRSTPRRPQQGGRKQYGRNSGKGRTTASERAAREGRGRRDDRPVEERPRKPWSPQSGQLPKWISDQLARVTPKAKLAATTEHLMSAATFFSSGKYGKALSEAQQAKELSPRDATIREILALSAYRLGRWDMALAELRTFRRFTGENTHMPVEMDVLRALDRPKDVEEVWRAFSKMDPGMRETRNEAKVVFGSFLLDRGNARRAWEVTNPKKMKAEPEESELRTWYVAAKAAHQLGDTQTARQLLEAIERVDIAFPGLDELGRTLRND